MADYRAISDTEVDPDAPVTSELAYALRDNPIAIFEGASGAPKLNDLALPLGSASATNRGRDWVLARNALAGAGAVGTYAVLLYTGSDTGINPGSVFSGSDLRDTGTGGSAKTGSWMAMQRFSGAVTPLLFLRVS